MANKKQPDELVKGNIAGVITRRGLKVPEMAKMMGMGRTKLYEHLSDTDAMTLRDLRYIAAIAGIKDYRQLLLDPTKNERITTA